MHCCRRSSGGIVYNFYTLILEGHNVHKLLTVVLTSTFYFHHVISTDISFPRVIKMQKLEIASSINRHATKNKKWFLLCHRVSVPCVRGIVKILGFSLLKVGQRDHITAIFKN